MFFKLGMLLIMLCFEFQAQWDLVGQHFFGNGELPEIVSVVYVITEIQFSGFKLKNSNWNYECCFCFKVLRRLGSRR